MMSTEAQARITINKLLEDGRFAELRARDANLFGALQQLEQEEREALIGYLKSNVPLGDFEQVA